MPVLCFVPLSIGRCSARFTLLRLRQEVEARSDPAALILHVGDLSYANGDPDIWDSFFDGLEPFAASVPYMVAVGNHEVRAQGKGALRQCSALHQHAHVVTQ